MSTCCVEVTTPPQDTSKRKVIPMLFFTKHHAMKAYWEMEV